MTLQCELCPKFCVIEPGQSGDCRIRINLDDRLITSTYGYPCAVHVDPVEKKPLFHFLPQTDILSIATAGCNLHCKNCQNWEISQSNPENIDACYLPPESVVLQAKKHSIPSIAYTYTEPLVYYEYTLDTSRKAKACGLKNVLVTAGYINEKPLRKLLPFIDAANIDLKSFSDKFYRDICGGTLKPVLRTLEIAKSMEVLVEVTNLLIPTLNDSDQEIKALTRWIFKNLGPDTPLHFSRFYPGYQMVHLPPTSSTTLKRARKIAMDTGLQYVYIGNLQTSEGENTYCPGCKKLLIQRRGYRITRNEISNGKCTNCEMEIYGIWK